MDYQGAVILAVLGCAVLVVVLVVTPYLPTKSRADQFCKGLLVIVGIVFVVLAVSLRRGDSGKPLTSIDDGKYRVVAYSESHGQFLALLEVSVQKERSIFYYEFPSSMVERQMEKGKPDSLDVKTKGGFSRLVLHLRSS